MPAVTRGTLQPNHQGWWMKNAAARRAFEDEQVSCINAQVESIRELVRGAA
jgi:hypothetical protein